MIYSLPGRSATVIVAASNASNAWKNAADYICTGTSDDVQINAAMAALPVQGGTVQLSDGSFTIGAPLIPTVNQTKLRGQGTSATTIFAAVGANCNGYQFDATTQLYNLIFCSIEGITFDGNYNSGAGNSSGYGCHINYNLTHTFWDFYLRDVWFKNWANDGFWSTGGHGYVLDHVLGEYCNGNGLNFTAGFTDSPPRILHGTFKLNNGFGLTTAVADSVVFGNDISVNGGAYGMVLAASGCKAVGNQIRSNTQSGVHITGGGEGVQFIGNSVEFNGQHGLLLDNANCTIDANFFTGNSVTTVNTYDEINVAHGTFNAAGNFITGNVIDCASQSRYGINLAHSGDTATVLTANRIIAAATAPTNTLADTIILASGNFNIGPAFLCAPHVYAPVGQTTKSVSTTTMAAFDSTNVQTGNFIAPPSGIVMVSLRCALGSVLGIFAAFGLAAHGTVTPMVCNSHLFQVWTGDIMPLAIDFYVSGLTPGSTYNFDLLGCVSASSAAIYAFGESSTTPTLAAGGLGAPVVLTVLGQ